MNLFDWLRKRPQQPSTTQWQVRDRPGPLTAHEAWRLVWPVAQRRMQTPA